MSSDTVPSMAIERAREADLAEVIGLLERHHLPLDGVQAHISTMVVARDAGRVVGSAALERGA